jgi:hypothetical protein
LELRPLGGVNRRSAGSAWTLRRVPHLGGDRGGDPVRAYEGSDADAGKKEKKIGDEYVFGQGGSFEIETPTAMLDFYSNVHLPNKSRI